MLVAINISTCQTSIFAKNSSECQNFPYYLIAFSCSINLVLGFPAHCYILWLSLKQLIRGQSVEVFVFNTSLIEVIFNISFPFVIKQYFFQCSDCKDVLVFLVLLLLVGRPLFQSCICLERYLGVLHPVTFLKLKPIKYRTAIALIGWILIISSSLLITRGIMTIYNLLFPQQLIFLIIKVFTCLMVLRALKRPGPGDDVKKKDRVNQDKVKAFRIILVILGLSLLTYGPNVFCLMLYNILDTKIFLVCWSTCFCSGIMLGFVQPLLYLRRVKKVCLCFGI